MSSSLDALLFVFVSIFAWGTTELDDLVLRARGGVGGTVIKRDWLVRPSREPEEVASEDVFTSARRSIFHARGSSRARLSLWAGLVILACGEFIISLSS